MVRAIKFNYQKIHLFKISFLNKIFEQIHRSYIVQNFLVHLLKTLSEKSNDAFFFLKIFEKLSILTKVPAHDFLPIFMHLEIAHAKHGPYDERDWLNIRQCIFHAFWTFSDNFETIFSKIFKIWFFSNNMIFFPALIRINHDQNASYSADYYTGIILA